MALHCLAASLAAPLKMCKYSLLYLAIFSYFLQLCNGKITYDSSTLRDIGFNYIQSSHGVLSPNTSWPAEILRSAAGFHGDENAPPNRRKRKRRKRGKKGGVRKRLRDKAHRPPLPSILLANVQSLENKLDELRARIRFQRDMRDCNILCFTETWLTPVVPDCSIAPAEFFSVFRSDRTEESGKSKGGGVCVMTNNKWCDPTSVMVLSQGCSPHLEHLTVKCRPYYLPREFPAVIFTAVYIPPTANTDIATLELQDRLNRVQQRYPDAAQIIAGDFNKANLNRVMPEFIQHIIFPTRGENTLDHCYTEFKECYKATLLPAFGKSDHAAVFLVPKYIQRSRKEPPVTREVKRWTDHSVAVLQDALSNVDWDMF